MNLRIAVVGSGAIGSYYGAKLAYCGSDVLCVLKALDATRAGPKKEIA